MRLSSSFCGEAAWELLCFKSLNKDSDGRSAFAIAERIVDKIVVNEFVVLGNVIEITVSAGVYLRTGDGVSFSTALKEVKVEEAGVYCG